MTSAAGGVVRPLALGLIAATLAGVAATPPAAPAAGPAPKVEQMVVFRSGKVVIRTAAAREVRVKVGRRRCAVAQGTALAALVRSRVGRLGLLDFGSCSSRTRDGGGLFVKSIRGERNRGQDGWAYKVGRRGATAGAADPSGALGSGRLRRGQRVTWFYCRLRGGGCQPTLELATSTTEPGLVSVSVRGYDDDGRGVPVEGATVGASAVSAVTGPAGTVQLGLPGGTHTLVARKDGLVPSFPARVLVR